MNRRAQPQLRLQEKVAGLSVVVLTYYGAQMVKLLAKASEGWHQVSSDLVAAVSIPVIALVVAWNPATAQAGCGGAVRLVLAGLGLHAPSGAPLTRHLR